MTNLGVSSTTFAPTFGGKKKKPTDALHDWVEKQREGLVQRKVKVRRGGKEFERTQWVKPEEVKIIDIGHRDQIVKNAHVISGAWSKQAVTRRLNLLKKVPVFHLSKVTNIVFMREIPRYVGAAATYDLSTGKMSFSSELGASVDDILHEVGHAVFSTNVFSDVFEDIEHQITLRRAMRDAFDKKKSISKYAVVDEDPEEFLCECYRCYFSAPNRLKRIEPEVFKVFEEVFK